jgi:hypothetical protein
VVFNAPGGGLKHLFDLQKQPKYIYEFVLCDTKCLATGLATLVTSVCFIITDVFHN